MVKIKTYKSIILPVVLYGRETCFFILGGGGINYGVLETQFCGRYLDEGGS